MRPWNGPPVADRLVAMKRLLSLLALVVLAGAAPASGDRPAIAAAQGVVVFTSNRDGDGDIYAMNPDGTGLTQLTDEPAEDYGPIPSPDGKHILFHGGEDESSSVMNADGSGRHSLHACSFYPGGWSPDSRHVVCSAYEEGILILDTVDGTTTPLVDSGNAPAWSPDGRTIAFIDENRLFVVPATGGARRRLGIRKVSEYARPAWSLDSQRVAYISPGNGLDLYTLWTIRADGSGGRRIVQKVAEEPPQWSPDGSRIAFIKHLPHYVSAVFTVRSNGTGVHQVSVSRAGESSSEPSWSADGRLLLYSRSRFKGSEETDIYAARAGERGGHALTHPFPSGGANSEPRWLAGPRLTGGEPLPRTTAVSFKRKLAFASPIRGVTTDGRRAIPTLSSEKHPPLLVWDSATGRSVRGPRPCGDSYGPGQLVLAGTRLAWTCGETGNTFSGVWLETIRLGGRRPITVASSVEDDEGGNRIGNLVGRGGTIAFTNHHRGANETRDAWLLLPSKGSRCPDSGLYGSRKVCRPLPQASGGATTAVDAGRVLTVAPNGLVRILSASGGLLRSWSLGEGIVTARLRGSTLAVQHDETLDTYNAKTGAKAQTHQLASDGGPPPFLLDVQGDLVVYATGGAIHLLRLSDGRDRALRLPGAAPYLDARLEPAGLFVSWNKMYDRRPGRLAFVPMRAVRRAFK